MSPKSVQRFWENDMHKGNIERRRIDQVDAASFKLYFASLPIASISFVHMPAA